MNTVIRIQAPVAGRRVQFDLEIPDQANLPDFGEYVEALWGSEVLWWSVDYPPDKAADEKTAAGLALLRDQRSDAAALMAELDLAFRVVGAQVEVDGAAPVVIKPFRGRPPPPREADPEKPRGEPLVCGRCAAFIPDPIGDGTGIGKCRKGAHSNDLKYSFFSSYCRDFSQKKG